MLAVDVINSDTFLTMPVSTQCLYFHLCLRADDDGFVANPRGIQEMVKCGIEDLRILLEKRYILAFDETGVIVIKHWRLHNTIRKDRYTPTIYQEEMSTLITKESKVYTERERHPELVQKETENQNQDDLDNWFLKSQEIWEKTFAEYPKKYAEEKARYEWEKLVTLTPIIEDRIEMARMIYKAIRLYVADYKENNPEDTTFKYVPRLDNWFNTHLGVWEKRTKEQ